MVNVDYFNIDTNKVATTFTSKGMIGYNLPVNYTQGIGFTYKNNPSLLNDGGFLVGIFSYQVSDDIYGPALSTYDNDFNTIKIAHRILPPVVSDFDAITEFGDILASSPLGIVVTNKAYAWSSSPKDKFIIMEYTIKNISTSSLSPLYAGLFMDFDISPNGAYDQIDFDATNKMGYTYSTQGGHMQPLNYFLGTLHHFAFDNNGISYGTNSPASIEIDNGFSSIKKYTAMSTTINRNQAGFGSVNGNDVSDMISSEPFNVRVGDSVIVTFALIAGDNLADIQASAIEADKLYNHTGINEVTLNSSVQLSDIYPNPANGLTSVNLYLPLSMVIHLSLFDSVGRKLLTISQGTLTQGNHTLTIQTKDLTSGIYHLRLGCENIVLSKDVTIIK